MSNPYIPNSTEEIRSRLKREIGIRETEELFSDLPKNIRLTNRLRIPYPLSELQVRRQVDGILKKNHTVNDLVSFLGAGTWPHYVPAVVDAVSTRSEFLTSYTPYQSEISQGTLQALFEYQSMVCELVGMEVANSSMYDWASSLGEAARMAARVTQKNEFLVPHFISPERMMVLRTYAEPADIKILEIEQSLKDGQINLEDLKNKISDKTAGLYAENPSYLGFLVDSPAALSEIVHDAGGLLVIGVDPTSLGVLSPPGNYGADIAIGEGQPLGNYMNGGGPLLGIFACRGEDALIRQMPGRIIGMTTTLDGSDRAFCMALQTREQHIRRHRATSNICTNEALCALRTSVYLSLLGRNGLKEIGLDILRNAHSVVSRLSEIDGIRAPLFNSPFFKEFVVNFDKTSKSVKEVNQGLLRRGILGGKPLDVEFPELGQSALYCVTEMHNSEEIAKLHRDLKVVLED